MGTFFGSDPIRRTTRKGSPLWMPPNKPLQPTSGAKIAVE